MRKKVVVSLAFLFTVFTLGAIVASAYVNATTEELRNLVDLHEIEGLRRKLVISVQAVQADLYTARTPLAPDLDAILAHVENLDVAADECASCHHRPEIEQQFDEVSDLLAEYKVVLGQYITASGDKERLTRLEVEAAGVADQLLLRTTAMSAAASARLAELADKAADKINRVSLFLFATLLITTGLGAAIAMHLVRSVTRPIDRLVRATRVIASGDLKHRIRDGGEAEFRELASHFNAMSAELEKSHDTLKSANVDLRREIHEREQAEREREELQEQLLQARKLEALGTLSAGIAHEFSNFLQVIQGCVARVTARAEAKELGLRELDMIGDAAQRSADLTRRLLTFGSDADSELGPIDINETVRHAEKLLEKTLPGTIEVETRLVEGILPIAGDPARIEQVLLNLALNARDAMPDGGLLQIETSRRGLGGPHPEAPAAGETAGWAVLTVSDSGLGMDEETRRHIFDPFFTTKKIGVGTGLGLATVYGIVRDHGGQIDCRSEVGRGTQFEIRLPLLAADEVAVQAAAKSLSEAHRGRGVILWVDDEVTILEVMQDNLVAHGYEVHTANSGEEALERFAEDSSGIDLVVLDLGMPGMGGRACLAKLLGIDPKIKVIVTTGFGTRADEEEMMQAGARGFLAKPAEIPDILDKIQEVLDA